MELLDIKLKLQAGMAIKPNGYDIAIVPLTLREIIEYGYTSYLENLNIISLETGDFFNLLGLEFDFKDALNVLDFMLTMGDEDVEDQLIKAFELFLRADVKIDRENLMLVVRYDDLEGKYLINRDNYYDIVEVIKYQNYIYDSEGGGSFNPADEEARKFQEQMDALRNQVSDIKKKQDGDEDDGIEIYEIISAISSQSNSTDELSVYSLTIYQMYTKFKRLEMIDQYYLGIKSMMAGAKDVKIKHWASKFSKKQS